MSAFQQWWVKEKEKKKSTISPFMKRQAEHFGGLKDLFLYKIPISVENIINSTVTVSEPRNWMWNQTVSKRFKCKIIDTTQMSDSSRAQPEYCILTYQFIAKFAELMGNVNIFLWLWHFSAKQMVAVSLGQRSLHEPMLQYDTESQDTIV